LNIYSTKRSIFDLSSYEIALAHNTINNNELYSRIIIEGFTFVVTGSSITYRRNSYYDVARISRDDRT